MFNIINRIFSALMESTIFLTKIFDYVIRFLYSLCGSYTISLVLFALLVQVLMLPLDYRSTLLGKRLRLISDKLEKARVDGHSDSAAIYKNRRLVLDQEGIRSESTGFVTFLRMYLMIGIVRVIYTPISSILMISDDVRSKAAEITMKLFEGTSKAGIYPADMTILDKVASDPSAFAALPENFLAKATSMNEGFTLFGVNLVSLPTDVSDFSGWKLLVGCMPLIYAVLMFVSSLCYAKKYKRKLRLSQYLMPIYLLFFSVQLPLGISFYWICRFVISLTVSGLIDWYLNEDRVKRIHEQKKKTFVPKERHFNSFMDGVRYDIHKMTKAALGGKIDSEEAAKKAAEEAKKAAAVGESSMTSADQVSLKKDS